MAAPTGPPFGSCLTFSAFTVIIYIQKGDKKIIPQSQQPIVYHYIDTVYSICTIQCTLYGQYSVLIMQVKQYIDEEFSTGKCKKHRQRQTGNFGKVFLPSSLCVCFNVLFTRIKRCVGSDFHLPGGWSFLIMT